MKLEKLEYRLSVCRMPLDAAADPEGDFYVLTKTDEEVSLVCETRNTPPECEAREDGWRAFRIKGILDFSLIGILSELSTVLAKARIGIFAVSTYNTDYILVKEENFQHALKILEDSGYTIV